MSVARIGISGYTIDFGDGANIALHAVQGETERIYNFTIKDMYGEVITNTDYILYMVVYVKGKRVGIVHGVQQANGTFNIPMPQGFLHEADNNAKYQLFVKDKETTAMVSQKAGDLIIEPNHNYQGGGVNLLVDFNALQKSIDRALYIYENFGEIDNELRKLKESRELQEIVEAMFSESDMAKINTMLTELENEVGKNRVAIRDLRAEFDGFVVEMEKAITLVERVPINTNVNGRIVKGEYIVYSNGKVEFSADVQEEGSIGGVDGGLSSASVYYGRVKDIKFPIKFIKNPNITVSEVRWSTGAGNWAQAEGGTVSPTQATVTVFSPIKREKGRIIIHIEVNGYVNLDDYKL